ncbi:MAG: DUF1501 domain-containing protein [Deltaproteobacteria bacterium]|nr:DUF1501 domain-containing protein [Nannocystaceae bacterium]
MMQRRHMLRSVLGLSGMGLISVATGLPAAFLRQPLAWGKDEDEPIDPDRAQYLILSGLDSGDPFNANAPGSYELNGIVHGGGPAMAKTALTLGTVATHAAQLWSSLPQNVLDRSTFIHHATRTQVHGELVKVLQLLGDASKSETITAIFAKYLAPALGTVNATPVPVGDVNMSAGGRILPRLKPTTLRELLVADDSPLNDLQTLRDEALDEIHLTLKAQGTTEQRKFMDDHSSARADVRMLSEGAVDLLGPVTNDKESAQIRAAVALIKLKLTPVVALAFPFGGDNHNDQAFEKEIEQHTSGIGYIGELMALLASEGLSDRVTFASLNVFGRTLKNQGTKGRTHHSKHHVTMMVGRYVNAGVVGGLEASGDDFQARAIDSMTGLASDSGDISYDDGLPSVGKTLGAVLGLHDATLDTEILKGKIISAAVAE